MTRFNVRKRRQVRRRLLAGVGLLGLLVGVVALPAANETDAAWTDAEHGATGLASLTLQKPSVNGTVCNRPTLFNANGPALTVEWSVPANHPTSTTAVWRLNGTVFAPARTTNLGNGQFRSIFTNGQLFGLFQGIQDHVFTIKTAVGNNWQSAQTTTIDFKVPPFAGNPTCTVS